MHRLSVRDLSVEGKRVLMRVDFNVPLQGDSSIRDDLRIRALLPTIEYLMKQKASIVLMSHMGRPGGKVDPKLSLEKVATRLSELLKHPVQFVSNCVGPKAKEAALKLKPTDILMLENLRFHQEEEYPDEKGEFARELASMGVVYVNDAFGVSHRKHTSVYEVPKLFEAQAACGFLMEKEIEYLSKIILSPPRPFFAIIGGAKVSTKIGVIESLLKKVDSLTICGGGDSLAAINQIGVGSGFSHLSTGGGASLEYIEYGTLPGIEVLSTI